MKVLHIVSVIVLLHYSSSCIDMPSSECPSIEEECRCSRKEGPNNSSLVICCNITLDFVFKESRSCARLLIDVTDHVVIYNSSFEYFDASLEEWMNLTTLTLTNNTIKSIKGRFKGSLTCVNLSRNSLLDIEPYAFRNLSNLTLLDLSNNNITELPILYEEEISKTISKSNSIIDSAKLYSPSGIITKKSTSQNSTERWSSLVVNVTADANVTANVRKTNLTLDISGNLRLECQGVILLMNNTNRNESKLQVEFNNRDTTVCLASQSFHWFNSTSAVTLEQLQIYQGLTEHCRNIGDKCNCSTDRGEFEPGNPLKIGIKVVCCGQKLTELPKQLPPNTIHLDISNNNISSLDYLITNPTYSDIRELKADNNKITSITSLERSQFIDKLTLLSIRSNDLKSVPIYMLSNTFDRNMETKRVNLGGNKLNCDCNTAQVLKLWLLANKAHIPDFDEVLCEKDLEKVINLDQNKVCAYQKDWTDYIYYIIAAEVILLLLLISKVSYDYWVFKTTGYLPWPASKMPKLPCDWVFET